MDTTRNRSVDRPETGSKLNRTRDWILQSHDACRSSISEHQPTNTTHHINRNVYTGVRRLSHGNRDDLQTGKYVVDVLHGHESFKKGLEAIVDLASETLGNHDFKIRKTVKDIECMKLTTDADDSDVNSAPGPLLHEISTKEDKHMELKKQRRQYISYLKRKRDTLKRIYIEKEFDLLNDIRKNFGIECRRLQSALPVYARREQIVKLVMNNQVCVIIGETGSGKSTQLVQYLYHAGIAGDHLIACTQPRKIAAISLATYVSSELASSVGETVGYRVGMKSRKSPVTRLMYMTDHTLLNECLRDELLESYSCIVIDEAHERSIYTDLLLGMLKAAMKKRPELKVIVTSATINPETFVAYFGGAKKCPVMYVSGRTYPVQAVFDESESNPFPDDYEIKAINKSIEIHKNVPLTEGDILVFLTSPLEVDKCCERFRKRIPTDDHICLPLYGSLQVEEQQLVFKTPAEGKRKIVFATNCAETSITIPGIKHVIDTGVAKEMRFDAKKNMNTLSVVAISQSSADQRKGRAGRTAPGVCYRLYSESDFQTMDKMGKPEILRVHLGQGLLTLLELGVNPISFDFVESPSAEAIENAMHSLQCIGAVSDTNITDLGKWIAKLQVEPRLGIIIKHGIDNDIPVEGIVIAACCMSSGIFFRAGSEEDKKKADLKKLKFCHNGGDLLSMLNAYREWRMIGEKSKGIWCRSNSINGKAMKLVNDMVNEILSLLRKTMTLDITNELSTCEHVDSTVQKLIFKCMKWNICVYLGHEKAGYLTCDTHQPVRIHPSSSLMSLGVNHKWVVFSQIIQTSDSFITNVTPVTDADVEQALTDNMICMDKDTIESSKVGLAAKVTLGPFAQRKIVGAMHRNRRQLETKISAAFNNTLIILDWDKDTCQMELYSRTEYKESARQMFIDELTVVTEPLITESREEFIGKNTDGTRAVIQAGLAVRDILAPSQYRCIHVKVKLPVQSTISEDDLERMMHSYGDIECMRVAHGNRFLATFCNADDAMNATCSVNADENSEIVIEPERYIERKGNTLAQHTSKEEGFTLRASWCRRPSKGFCYVHLNNPDDELQLRNAADRLLTQHHIRIKKNAKGELMLHDLGAGVDENELVQHLANAIDVTLERNDKRIRVVIPRENVPADMNETNNIRQRFTDHISKSTGNNPENCRVDIKEYKAQTARNTAFLRFRNVDDCQAAADCLASGFRINMALPHTEVSVTMEIHSSVHIHRAIFAVVKEEVDFYMAEKMERNSKTTFVSKVLKSGHTIIDIKSESLTKLAKARQTIQRFIESDTLDGKSSESVAPMFSKSGRWQVQQIENKCYCVIFMNIRTQTLNIHGPVAKRQQAADMIRSFLNQSKNAGKNEKQICLKGKDNPPGLLKTLIMKYSIDLDVLRQECELLAVSLNVRTHVVTLLGSDENVARAVAIIDEIKSDIPSVATGREDQAECPICLCPVDLEDVSRLEYCGHPYCSFCLTTLVQNAIQDKSFPIECAADGCGKPLVIKDINSQIKQGNVTIKSIATASLECFVTKNNSKFRYCATPDCPMVYRVTTDMALFSCSQCLARICTACHVQYHDSLTCAMNNIIKDEKDCIKAWMKLNPGNGKQCPKCKVIIEKDGGCNHMTCICGAHICWLCLACFSNADDCYIHLGSCPALRLR